MMSAGELKWGRHFWLLAGWYCFVPLVLVTVVSTIALRTASARTEGWAFWTAVAIWCVLIVLDAAMLFKGYYLGREHRRYELDYIERELKAPEKVLETLRRRLASDEVRYAVHSAQTLLRLGMGPYSQDDVSRVRRAWGSGLQSLFDMRLFLQKTKRSEGGWNWDLVMEEFPMPSSHRPSSKPGRRWWRVIRDLADGAAGAP